MLQFTNNGFQKIQFSNRCSHDIVPVVMGASLEEAKRVSPPNSFIHVDHFRTPRELADYLNWLDVHDDHYNEFFRLE